MSKQTEAQRLATELASRHPAPFASQVAAELLRQEALIAELAASLDSTLLLSVGWASLHQHRHGLDDFHPTHADIIEKARAALAKVQQ